MVIAWREARKMAEQLEELTEMLGESIAEERLDELAPLLERRQGICDRLDRLRLENGITSWVEGGGSPEIEMASREIKDVFSRLTLADEEMRQVLLEKMAVVQGDLAKIRQLRRAQRAYLKKSGSLYGAFIDNKL